MNPPRLAAWLLRRVLPVDGRDCLIGDLAEEYRDLRAPRRGALRARLWYWGQALRSIAHQLALGDRDGAAATDPQVLDGLTAPPPTAPRPGDGFMSNVFRDIRYGVRALLQTPTFTFVTILTLGLAIGVNTAIFSMVNVLMFQPLPIADTDSIAFIYFDHPERGVQDARMSAADFLDYRDTMSSLTDLSAVNRGRGFIMTGHEEPARIIGFEATANTFDMWGLQPILGRGFRPGDDEIGAERVVVLSHGTWERRFGSDPEVLGRTIRLDGFETTIIGVLGPEIEFGGLATAELWVPLYLDRAAADRDTHFLWVSGRLAAGISHEQAQQEVDTIAAGLVEQYPESNAGWVARVEDMNGALANDQVWTIFNLMFLTVAFVMLIACSNIATMMLSRSAARTKEIAVRAALGAQRSRLLAQMFVESLLLSVGGAALGLLTTRVCLSGLVWMAGDNPGTNFFSLLTIDRNVLLFTGAVALLAPLLFGFVPALRASRAELSEALKDSSRGSTGTSGLRGRKILVATQVSLALSLMVIAGLLIRTMVNQRIFDLGIETHGVLTFRLDLPDGRYAEEHQWLPFFDAVMERVDALPGIGVAGLLSSRPIQEADPARPFLIEGTEIPAVEDLPFTTVTTATQGAFAVLELPVVRGRGFEPSDTQDGLPVVLVNEDMVRRYWDGDSPLGRRIRLGGLDSTEPWLTVVGVVSDLFSGDPDNPAFPQVYVPLHQHPRSAMGFVARPLGDPLAIVPALREQVWAVDPDQPLGDVRTLTQIFSDNLAVFDTIITIFVVFAVFALIMASTGIYGVISFAVTQRTQEIGIRMALGAHRRDVMRMIRAQAMWLVGAGIVMGAVGAFVLSRILAGAVPGMSSDDPLALGGVALVLAGAAWLAIWVPARRAVRIDPIIALRQD